MSLGADIASALPELRAQAESRMVDSCVIRRPTTTGDPDPETARAASSGPVIYSGRCEFKSADTQARSVASAGRDLVQQGATLKLPVDAPGSASVVPGDVATITLATNDPSTPAFTAAVSGSHHQTYATARRLPVEVIGNG